MGLIAGVGDFGLTELRETTVEKAADVNSDKILVVTKTSEATSSATTATAAATTATTKASQASTASTTASTAASTATTKAAQTATDSATASSAATIASQKATQASVDAATASTAAALVVQNAEIASAAAIVAQNIADSIGDKMQFIQSVNSLKLYLSADQVVFDGSVWEKKSGDKQSNGGDFAGTIVRVSSSAYWERLFDNYISVKWFGAKGDSITDDTIAIQKALDLPFVCTIFFPPGTYKVSSQLESCLYLNTNKSLIGDAIKSIIRADNCSNNTAILKICISENLGNTDVRNLSIADLTMFHNNGGKDCILIKDSFPMLNCNFENISLSTTTGYSISVKQEGFAFNTIRNCTIQEGIFLDGVADGNKILDSTIYGNKVGILLDIVDGSFLTLIKGNTIVNRDGAITVKNGSQIKIENNQFEFALSNSGSSTSTYKHTIWIKGETRQSYGVDIIANNFGGGTNLDNSVVIDNATDTHISRNRFNIVNNNDILLLSNSQYNYCHFDNCTTGGTRRNDKFRLIITDTGKGNFGVLKATTNTSAGGYSAGTTFYKDPSTEEVVLGESVGGATAVGTIIITMPVGFKPKDFYILPCSAYNGVCTVVTNPTSGDIALQTASASNSNVGGNIRFTAKRD